MGGWRGDEGCQTWHASEVGTIFVAENQVNAVLARLRTTDKTFIGVEH